jgi:uncharacterized C2H2 Zn-finger protein
MQQDGQQAPDKHICGKCGAEFETQEELDRHVEETHGEGEGSGGS